MHKLLILILTMGMATNSFAVVKTPVHKKPVERRHETQETKVRIGWYLEPVLKIGEIHDEIRPMVGIRGGLEINRSFYVGLAGYGLARPESSGPGPHSCYSQYDDYNYNNEWDLGYGGLEFGIIAGRPQTGQLSLGMLVGGGATNEHGFDYYNTGYTGDNHSDYHTDYHHKHGFFVLEPQLDLSASVARNVRLSVGGSYRFVDHVKSFYYTQDDLQGPTFNIGVAIGIF
jgi:hypothetical protein